MFFIGFTSINVFRAILLRHSLLFRMLAELLCGYCCGVKSSQFKGTLNTTPPPAFRSITCIVLSKFLNWNTLWLFESFWEKFRAAEEDGFQRDLQGFSPCPPVIELFLCRDSKYLRSLFINKKIFNSSVLFWFPSKNTEAIVCLSVSTL